jgi:hypothetical protein
MGKHPESTLSLPRSIGPTTEGTSQSSLVPREGRLGLPSLTEYPTVLASLGLLAEPLDHLPPVLGLGPLAALTAAVQGNYGGPHPEFLAAMAVMLFAVECGVGQHSVPDHSQGCLDHDRTQLRGIVGRAGGDRGPSEEVAFRIAGDG